MTPVLVFQHESPPENTISPRKRGIYEENGGFKKKGANWELTILN